jgi:hypothetical protein
MDGLPDYECKTARGLEGDEEKEYNKKWLLKISE